jgi:tRNA nucleotidyltransferase (CCA-adding enzyme)
VEVILTHTNADFDAVAALLAAQKLYPQAIPVLPDRLRSNVAEFIMLYQNGLPFVRWRDFRPKNVSQIIMVDTQRAPSLRNAKTKTPVHIIDHHPPMGELEPHQTIQVELLGATTTLLVESIQREGITLNSLEATLLALGIYEDTGSLTYRTTTPRDARAAAWLLEQNAALDTMRRFLGPTLNDEQQALFDRLLATLESRNIQGYTITVAAAVIDAHMPEVNSIAHRLRDVLDSAAIFVMVKMPDTLQLVCRGTNEAVDVGEIARFFGGGGHGTAAAATIKNKTLETAVALLWEQLQQLVRPAVRVGDLMSYGVQTVSPEQRAGDIIQQMRRIGHEGFPVVEGGRVIGLLTRREVDRAIEHGLGHIPVRDIMTAGEITLTPDDSVSTLEQVLVESGWGQVPIINADNKLIGIVTRTDLINHWARSHPAATVSQNTVSTEQVEKVLGTAAARFIDAIAQQAQKLDVSLYLVGGAVRDLLLYRRNLDIDFVVEGNAIQLAESLCEQFGGKVSPHRPFGTAKWIFDGEVADALGVSVSALPDHIDFAASRNEFYEHPTALPTVYGSSIKLDLQRRDFTINAMAIQLSPASAMWRVLDFYGGLTDLDNRLIRVLHSLSFVDDPTRVLRAVRFEQRLGFAIEPRTAELIDTSLPMLRRITGKRLRNELSLLLQETEPERGLLKLQHLGATEAIHPAFVINAEIGRFFEEARTVSPSWPMDMPDIIDLYWHMLAATIEHEKLPDLCERLMCGRTAAQSYLDAATLVQDYGRLIDPSTRPSQLARYLEDRSEVALLTGWIMIEDDLAKAHIQRYMTTWRHIQPTTTGHTLQAMGLKPGPHYRRILDRLRIARLDGDITSDDDESILLHQLIDEEVPPDDRA